MDIQEADIAAMGRAELEELIDRAVRPDVPLRVLFAALDRYTELLRPVLDDETETAGTRTDETETAETAETEPEPGGYVDPYAAQYAVVAEAGPASGTEGPPGAPGTE